MVHVASEMQRQGFTMPLLIGGATTSRIHTALRVDPGLLERRRRARRRRQSRAAGVISKLLSDDRPRDEFLAELDAEYRQRDRGPRACRGRTQPRCTIDDARANAGAVHVRPARRSSRPPSRACARSTTIDLAELVPYIDWTPFFHVWGLRGRYPAILDRRRARRGRPPAVRRRPTDARPDRRRALVRAEGRRRVLAGAPRRRRHRACLHAMPAWIAAARTAPAAAKRETASRTSRSATSSHPHGAECGSHRRVRRHRRTGGVAIAERFEDAGDDYSSILVKSLADRIAEALAEHMHARVRRELWGYAPDEPFSPEELIGEPYRGIRPAPGYPAQPDHCEKATHLRTARRRGADRCSVSPRVYAMWPGSSVSGLYFAHPDCQVLRGRTTSNSTRSRATRTARASPSSGRSSCCGSRFRAAGADLGECRLQQSARRPYRQLFALLGSEAADVALHDQRLPTDHHRQTRRPAVRSSRRRSARAVGRAPSRSTPLSRSPRPRRHDSVRPARSCRFPATYRTVLWSKVTRRCAC